jgi:hypothetical protein
MDHKSSREICKISYTLTSFISPPLVMADRRVCKRRSFGGRSGTCSALDGRPAGACDDRAWTAACPRPARTSGQRRSAGVRCWACDLFT